ncbi:delta-60 repeat domain-containing protein [bacterium]|nr:delta-60 repeat domain-containing protein [bacterium]MCI0602620.1 delta-60 repeat domain-containing protein [bacterium]
MDAVFAVSCHTSTGTLDSSFGTLGRVTTDMGAQWEEISEILIQKDGKIIAVGLSRGSDGSSRFAIARYLGCGL